LFSLSFKAPEAPKWRVLFEPCKNQRAESLPKTNAEAVDSYVIQVASDW